MIVPYCEKYKYVWDEFVLKKSINGNFLQTRNFYDYHSAGKFKDASMMFYKNEKLAAVIPANETDEGRMLLAHEGSTYGGIVIGRDFANTPGYSWIFQEMINYFKSKGYETVELRMHNWLYSPDEKHHELLDYYFQLNGFSVRCEVGFYIELTHLEEDYANHFEKLRKRKLNRALRYGLSFRKLESDRDVTEFYTVLTDNMKKFNTVPIHSLKEILEFKNFRLADKSSFYGVFYENRMVAGSMVFDFCEKKVFHTQYLASRHDCLDCCPNEFLYANLIRAAREEGYRYLSFGTSSLEHGKVYNESLGMYKEGFNTDSYLNRCYIWEKEK